MGFKLFLVILCSYEFHIAAGGLLENKCYGNPVVCNKTCKDNFFCFNASESNVPRYEKICPKQTPYRCEKPWFEGQTTYVTVVCILFFLGVLVLVGTPTLMVVLCCLFCSCCPCYTYRLVDKYKYIVIPFEQLPVEYTPQRIFESFPPASSNKRWSSSSSEWTEEDLGPIRYRI